jgi:hypothetical protein
MAIKGTSSSSKCLFPKLNQGKHTCLMAKESKHKVKIKGSSSPKYVSSDDNDASDDDDPLPRGMNEKAVIKRLGKELIAQDQLLEVQEDLVEQERKTTCELKRLLKLEKEKNEKLAQGKETISSLKSSSGALQDSYYVLQNTHKDLEVQFDALWASTSKPSSTPETTKDSTSNGCERCYNVAINAICAQSQHFNIEQVLVESCDEAIGRENDNLRLEVMRLEQKVSVLEKHAKAQPSQDNRRTMVNKLKKGKTVPKLAPQQQMKPSHRKKEERVNFDEKIEYARRVFLNVRRPHITNGIGYKSGDKNNSRVNSNDKEFIKFTKGNSHQERKQSLNTTNHVSYASNANASYVSHMSYHEFDASSVLMRNKFGRIVALYVQPHHKRSKAYVWVPKCLFTNLKGPKQIWVPKSKT